VGFRGKFWEVCWKFFLYFRSKTNKSGIDFDEIPEGQEKDWIKEHWDLFQSGQFSKEGGRKSKNLSIDPNLKAQGGHFGRGNTQTEETPLGDKKNVDNFIKNLAISSVITSDQKSDQTSDPKETVQRRETIDVLSRFGELGKTDLLESKVRKLVEKMDKVESMGVDLESLAMRVDKVENKVDYLEEKDNKHVQKGNDLDGLLQRIQHLESGSPGGRMTMGGLEQVDEEGFPRFQTKDMRAPINRFDSMEESGPKGLGAGHGGQGSGGDNSKYQYKYKYVAEKEQDLDVVGKVGKLQGKVDGMEKRMGKMESTLDQILKLVSRK
jgi:hypothetical protein